MNKSTKQLIVTHYNTYPKMQIQDVFKFIFQSAFGCEHLVSSEERALAYINAELERIKGESYEARIDRLDGDYSRVHLSCINEKLSAEDLAKYFCLSAKVEPEGMHALTEKIKVARELILDGTIPLSLSEFDELHSKWQEAGYPTIHHSEAFREAYKPAYRVVANEYVEKIYQLTKDKDRV